MASRYHYRYAYESQIPKMMSLINPTAPTPNNVRELYEFANDNQRDLWRIIVDLSNKHNSSSKIKRSDGAIRQYHLEKDVWMTYCKFVTRYYILLLTTSSWSSIRQIPWCFS